MKKVLIIYALFSVSITLHAMHVSEDSLEQQLSRSCERTAHAVVNFKRDLENLRVALEKENISVEQVSAVYFSAVHANADLNAYPELVRLYYKQDISSVEYYKAKYELEYLRALEKEVVKAKKISCQCKLL